MEELVKMKGVKLVPINIWDDYLADCDENLSHRYKQKTFAYVETDEIPLGDQKKYLIYLMGHIGADPTLFDSEMSMSVELYNSRVVYPSLPENIHSKRWELRFVGLSHKLRERYVEELNNGDLPFRIYSES